MNAGEVQCQSTYFSNPVPTKPQKQYPNTGNGYTAALKNQLLPATKATEVNEFFVSNSFERQRGNDFQDNLSRF